MEVTQARRSKEVESDIDWGGIDTYTDCDMGTHLVNNAQTRDFAELRGPQDVEAYRAFGKEQISRINKGKKEPLKLQRQIENRKRKKWVEENNLQMPEYLAR